MLQKLSAMLFDVSGPADVASVLQAARHNHQRLIRHIRLRILIDRGWHCNMKDALDAVPNTGNP